MVAISLKGIREVRRDRFYVYIDVNAGEVWDDFVQFTIKKGYWGCENLSLIPGLVGATPVQNVGAFGQEVKYIIHSVRCYDRACDKFVNLTNAECQFEFRSSIFNSVVRNRYVICSIVFKLSLVPLPCLNRPELWPLKLVDKNSPELQSDIRARVIAYRTNGKNLPVGEQFGSSGTFFKTGVINTFSGFYRVIYRTLVRLGPKAAIRVMTFGFRYRSTAGYKIPSKSLIQLCGLADLTVGAFFLLPSNPACVVSRLQNSPSSDDLVRLIDIVVDKVLQNTGVSLPIEPELLGFSYDVRVIPHGK